MAGFKKGSKYTSSVPWASCRGMGCGGPVNTCLLYTSGPGEPDCEIHVGVSGPGAVRAALARLPKDAPIDEVAELVKRMVISNISS